MSKSVEINPFPKKDLQPYKMQPSTFQSVYEFMIEISR